MKRGKLLFLCLFFAGCAIGPDYVEPELDTPGTFSGAALDPSYNQGKEDLGSWWKNFGDATLDHLIFLAVLNNNDIGVALARVDEARALRRRAFKDLLPGARSNFGYTTREFSTVDNRGAPDFDRTNEFYNVGIDALWELDIFGRLRRGLEQSRAEEESAMAEVQDVLRSLLAEVALTYVDLRGTQHRLDVARKNAENQKKTAELVDALVSGGRGTDLDRARAQAQLNRTLASVPDLEAIERIDMHRLAVLVGQAPGALIDELKVSQNIPSYKGPISLGSPASLIKRRPDVKAAERKVAAETAGVGVAYGDLFPIVNFSGSFSFEARRFTDLGSSDSRSYSYGPSISWIALDVGRILSNVDAANARVEQSLLTYQQSVLLALEDTENSLVRFAKEKERRDFLLTAADESRKAADLANTQFREGLTDLLTVLQSERDALDAEDSLVKSESAMTSALIGIYKSLSGGWQSSEEGSSV